jgi:lysophospholipid acyltransferase (LPLAT)-like uncharacterized protein
MMLLSKSNAPRQRARILPRLRAARRPAGIGGPPWPRALAARLGGAHWRHALAAHIGATHWPRALAARLGGTLRRHVVAARCRHAAARASPLAMFTRLLNSQAAQRAAAAMLGAYLAFALRTTRWTIEGEQHLAPFRADTAVIIAFWHECLPLMPAGWATIRRANPARRGAVLISRHRDGRFIAAILRRFAVEVVHGSSAKPGRTGPRDKGGAAAVRALLGRLAGGEAVIVTPDGPRGPARVAAGGTLQLAALSGAPVLPAAARLRHHLTLNTWDRMILPLPFGRGAIVCLPPLRVPRAAREAAGTALGVALDGAAARAGELCGL